MKRYPFAITYGLIVVISLLMMLAVLHLPFKAKPFGDIVFHQEAQKMALFLKGVLPASQVTITWAPGPVFFYAIPYFFAPTHATDDLLWSYGITWTGIFMTLSMLLIFRIATRFFGTSVAVLSIVLFFIFPIQYYYSLGITGEAPAFFALSLMLYGWSRSYYLVQDVKGWVYMGSGYWFLLLNRPNAILFFVFLLLMLLYTWKKSPDFFFKYARPTAITFGAVFIASIGITQVTKAINAGYQSPQEGLFYYVAQQGRFQFREEPTDFRFWDDEKRVGSIDYQNWVRCTDSLHQVVKTGVSYTDAYRNFVISDVLNHPFYTIRQFFVKALYGHVYYINSIEPSAFKLGPMQGKTGFYLIIFAINLVNMILLVGLFLFVFKHPVHLPFWPFYAVILSLVIFHGLMYMEARYLFPSKPAFYMLSAAGLYRLSVVKKPIDAIAHFLIPKIVQA